MRDSEAILILLRMIIRKDPEDEILEETLFTFVISVSHAFGKMRGRLRR